MTNANPELIDSATKTQILGYLNYSSGTQDPQFFKNLDQLFFQWKMAERGRAQEQCASFSILDWLRQQLDSADLSKPAGDSTQARSILTIAREHLLPAYLAHHQNLLFHQNPDFIFNSFFTAQALMAALSCAEPYAETDRVVAESLNHLNSFIGHRPVATLESQKIEPYQNEWVAPVPVYMESVGAAFGPYQSILKIAIRILDETNPELLRSAMFFRDKLQQIAIDPRAFDFDHPINKRPNYHFGQWDEHTIDDSGYFNRFIIHQVTLDALLDRVAREQTDDDPRFNDQLVFEAGAVLACTILMASGISGWGPGAFDSNTTIGHLLPTIAGYRDQFYQELIDKLPSEHRNRLVEEAESKRQPFGAARQDLNRMLSKRRASQLVNCRLASIYARMGFSEAAENQANVVPVASARILSQIDCLLSSAQRAVKRKQLGIAYQIIPQVMQRLKSGVQCGAIVDPWNIIGFDANYSLFPANENTVPDHRVYELVDLVERILGMCSMIWSEAAAVDDAEICGMIKPEFEGIVAWWRKYAAHEVMSVDAVDPEEIFSAAEFVAHALNLWHRGGAAAGDIEFWKQHADLFDAPKAYHLVVEALMDLKDYQTSSSLLVHWLSQAEYVRLQHGDSSFHDLMYRWISEQKQMLKVSDFEKRNEIWNRIRKFYDFIDANAEHYGQVPEFELGRPFQHDDETQDDEDEHEDSDTDLFEAAYEGITYRDSTDDGMESSIFDYGLSGDHSDDELEAEVDRVFDRLEFLGTIANYWRIAATIPLPIDDRSQFDESARRQLDNRRKILQGWIGSARGNRDRLANLLNSVSKYKISTSGVDHESLQAYDRHRLYKETLMERIVESCVESEYADCTLGAMISAIGNLVDDDPIACADTDQAHGPLVDLLSAVLLTDIKQVQRLFPAAMEYLHDKPLLYVPPSKGGSPTEIINARLLQEVIRDLAASLPVLGLFQETYELIETALAMERNHKRVTGAVTEFDELFEVAYTSMVKCLVQSTQLLHQKMLGNEDQDDADIAAETENLLFDCMGMVNKSMSVLWLNHSRALRLSVLEKVSDRRHWDEFVAFIKRYGSGLFTQQFLNISNARAILHQSVEQWLENVRHSANAHELRLFDELDRAISKDRAVARLKLVLEAVCENYSEYRDYNTTTTQSDHGELLYSLFDFIRLRNRYDRVSWNLKPIVWGHEILVRDGQHAVARMWRQTLKEKFGPEADRFIDSFEKLKQKYSMQMESISRRLEGRFVHEMQIDRLRALVKPAMAKPGTRSSTRAFEKLQQESEKFIQATPGVGLDLPAWLAALENEVQQFNLPIRLRAKRQDQSLIQPIDIPVAQLRQQLEQLPGQQD